MSEIFVHPYTKNVLEKDAEGSLLSRVGHRPDIFRCHDGCYDFSLANQDIKEAREAYDDLYARGGSPKLTLSTVSKPWSENTVPWRRTMLHSLGPLAGQKVLLLGNGKSYI